MGQKKKKTSIFKQLLISVLLPIIVLIGVLSIYNFFERKNQIHHSRTANIELINKDISSFLEFFDRTILELEKGMTDDARRYSAYLVDSAFSDTKNILVANLDSLKTVIGMPSNQDIYIIDTNGIIVNTTFEKDMGLDFFQRGDYYRDHFNNIWNSQEFTEDRISIEVSTNTPKKYTYQSTKDTNFIVELGIYADRAKAVITHFVDRIAEIPEKYEGIDSVSIYFGTDEFSSYYQKHALIEMEKIVALKTLNSKSNHYIIRSEKGIDYTSDFRYLKMPNGQLHRGYVIRVLHNNLLAKELTQKAINDFLINLLLFALPVFLLIFWRARVISRPITAMVIKTDNIRNGELGERVPITGNNEISDLGEHFNSMVDQLQESYESLEHKVEERTTELREQKDVIEEKNHQIMDSINYAKRIQNAILPSDESVSQSLRNSYVLYKPKDVVAGDFYWMESLEDSIFIAVADCTGHGVPGAMVSVVCNNALNRSVREYGLTDPGAVLDKTTDLVVEQFSTDLAQTQSSGGYVKDGMDISLARINFDAGTLHWSGANNPLWIMRNGEIIETKANKQPIGQHDNRVPFTTHIISLEDGDTIILFSDGYPDQFGGERGKKLKSKNFKAKLCDIADLSMAAQKQELDRFFKAWCGPHEQLDDVCVIGVRFDKTI